MVGRIMGAGPQPTRCDFFLWDDEAKPREAAVVLNNSRSEPQPTPQTPSKPISNAGYLTPESGSKPRQQSTEATPHSASAISSRPTQAAAQKPRSASQATTQDDSDEEYYEWALSDNEELSMIADQASSATAMPPPETPRKAGKTDILSTPGKRRFDEISHGELEAWPTPVSSKNGDDIFSTPATLVNMKNLFSSSSGQETPTPTRFQDVLPKSGTEPSLTTEVLAVLQRGKISLPHNVREDVKDLCNKQSLFTHGVLKGRDASRALVAKRDEKIAELQGSIEALQAERETSRAVIKHFRKELAASSTNGK
ncbi:MAG: hypothetical protein Q9191_006334 [Dirinaria sp. TL-2023a]